MKSKKVFERKAIEREQGSNVLDTTIKKNINFEIDLKEVGFAKVKMGVLYGGKDKNFSDK